MFKNSKNELVPHCTDCIHGHTVEDTCPGNATQDQVDNERGVLDCPGFVKAHCSDCTQLGDKLRCGKCTGGFGWICKSPANTDGSQVHPEMAMCKAGVVQPDKI